MANPQQPVRDYRGNVMFTCRDCGSPLSQDDFFDLGLRLPDPGESRGEYCETELMDDALHLSCLRARKAG